MIYSKLEKKKLEFNFIDFIYTQTTDVEGEVNGLLTYDREIIKMNEDELRDLNISLFQHYEN